MNTTIGLIAAALLAQPQQGKPDTFNYLLPGLLMAFLVFWWIMMSGTRKKEKKQREAMLAAMKKGDRVMTIGGAIGTVVNVKDNEIVLKVDESTNTKITYVRSAIQKVLAEDEKPTIDQR